MSTRVIKREFLYQPAYSALPAVTLAGAWSSFMNSYAGWPAGAGNNITLSYSLLLQAGNYYVTGAVDNQGSVVINGKLIFLYKFDANIQRTTVGNNTVVNHPGGYMTVVISALNFDGPRGVAVTISQYIKPIAGNPYVGNEVWTTRSTVNTNGRYLIQMPFRANITAYAWGGGGGGGGNDAGSQGGTGSHGLYNTRTFSINKGDLLEIFVGDGGNGGSSNAGGARGGGAGSSRINVNGDATKSFNGGSGSAAGPRPYSGAGGGGGGASGILVNNSPVMIAGGGGGGGGAGNDGNSAARYARRDAKITNNAIGAAGSDYRGENGQSKGGDGGGAGAGGGGYPGGQGGAVVGGDASGFAGQCGGNFPIYSATAGADSPYYIAGYAGGGARTGGNGQNGRVVLLIEPIAQSAIKVAGLWKQINETFVKVAGSWKDIDKVYVKIGDTWKQIGGAGQDDISFNANSQSYGTSARSYS